MAFYPMSNLFLLAYMLATIVLNAGASLTGNVKNPLESIQEILNAANRSAAGVVNVIPFLDPTINREDLGHLVPSSRARLMYRSMEERSTFTILNVAFDYPQVTLENTAHITNYTCFQSSPESETQISIRLSSESSYRRLHQSWNADLPLILISNSEDCSPGFDERGIWFVDEITLEESEEGHLIRCTGVPAAWEDISDEIEIKYGSFSKGTLMQMESREKVSMVEDSDVEPEDYNINDI